MNTIHTEVGAALVPPTDLPAFNNALKPGWPKVRKSGFPYFAKVSPLVPLPPKRYKSVRKSSEIDALLTE